MALTWKTTSTTDPDDRDALVDAGWEVYHTITDASGEPIEWRLRISSRDYVPPEKVLHARSERPEAQGYDPLKGVDFASDAALGLAMEKELDVTEGDFESIEPSGETGYTKADIEAAKAQAVKADRKRRAAIMALDEAKGREALAEHLYGTTEMSAEEIKGVLAKAPAQAAQTQTQPAGEPDRAHVAGAGLGGRPKAEARRKAEIKPSEIYAARRPQ